MNTLSRTGKIARLSALLREQVNQRLLDGESGPKLLVWLNALQETVALLAEEFGGRAITEQNLSEWRSGGYAAWLAQQDAQRHAATFAAQAAALSTAGLSSEVVFQNLLALYAVALSSWSPVEGNPAQAFIESLRPLLKDVLALRKSEQNALRLALEREKLEFRKSASQQVSTPLTSPSVAAPVVAASPSARSSVPVPAPSSAPESPTAASLPSVPRKYAHLFEPKMNSYASTEPLSGQVRPANKFAETFAKGILAQNGAI